MDAIVRYGFRKPQFGVPAASVGLIITTDNAVQRPSLLTGSDAGAAIALLALLALVPKAIPIAVVSFTVSFTVALVVGRSR